MVRIMQSFFFFLSMILFIQLRKSLTRLRVSSVTASGAFSLVALYLKYRPIFYTWLLGCAGEVLPSSTRQWL
jgi:hypothetical protein